MMWEFSPTVPELRAGEVHIWRAALDIAAPIENAYWQSLSLEEQQRANRYHFSQHRSAFIAGRGMLRHLIGQYLGHPPKDLNFTYGSQEKPHLKSGDLSFNVSHAYGWALFAFSLQGELGIDIEKIRTDIDIVQLSQQFFSPNEAKALLPLTGWAQYEAFFNCWTRKEAFIKAKGQGLSLPLDQFEVSFLPQHPSRVLVTRWDPKEALSWSLYPIFPQEGYVAALAINKAVKTLKTFAFRPLPILD